MFKKLFKKIKKNKIDSMFFDSIEDMENCEECDLMFIQDEKSKNKLEYYKIGNIGQIVTYNEKFYMLINEIKKENSNPIDVLEKEFITVATSGIPIYIRITNESIYSNDPYYIMYGYKKVKL